MLVTVEQLRSDILVNNNLKPDILAVLKSFLFTKVFLDEMKPTFNEACEAAIKQFSPVIEDRNIPKTSRRAGREAGTPITQFEQLYLASDETTKKIYSWHKAEMAKKGYIAEGENRCPYLVAENNHLLNESMLIDVMAKYTGIPSNKVWSREKRDKLIELLTGLLISLAEETNSELNIIKEVVEQ